MAIQVRVSGVSVGAYDLQYEAALAAVMYLAMTRDARRPDSPLHDDARRIGTAMLESPVQSAVVVSGGDDVTWVRVEKCAPSSIALISDVPVYTRGVLWGALQGFGDRSKAVGLWADSNKQSLEKLTPAQFENAMEDASVDIARFVQDQPKPKE